MSLSLCKHFKKELFWYKNDIMKGRQKGSIYGTKREKFYPVLVFQVVFG